MFTVLFDYTLLITPGLILVAACLILARNLTSPGISIAVLVAGFILIRDAMTPAGIWRIGAAGGVAPWIRLTDDVGLLVTFSVVTVAITACILITQPKLRVLVVWGRPSPTVIGFGIAGAAVAAAPVLLLSQWWPLVERGGAVLLTSLPAILLFCLCGNLLEEVLFRGFLQGRLDQLTTRLRAAVLSGLLFAVCHIFLATTVTDVGWPLLVFTAWEGLICAWLRLRFGLIPAVMAHGLAIASLTSGLL